MLLLFLMFGPTTIYERVLAQGQFSDVFATYDELDPNSPQMQLIPDILKRLQNGSDHVIMIFYPDGRLEIRYEDSTYPNQDIRIHTSTNYSRHLGYEIKDNILYNPNGTVLFR